ncbi:hypothetical protein Efla_002044 [Eimeria flavescens]
MHRPSQLLLGVGLKVLLLPHMEWSELRDSAEKQKYLWAFGRLAAASLQQEATAHFDEEEGSVYRETLSADGTGFALRAQEVLGELDEVASSSPPLPLTRGRRARRRRVSASLDSLAADLPSF